MRNYYDATNKEDMEELSHLIASFKDDAWYVVWYLYKTGLMKAKHPMLRVVLWLQTHIAGDRMVLETMKRAHEKHPNTHLSMLEETALHVRFGKDTEQKGSVGGWCQREVDIFLAGVKGCE